MQCLAENATQDFDQAYGYFQKKQYQKAITCYQKGLAIEKDNDHYKVLRIAVTDLNDNLKHFPEKEQHIQAMIQYLKNKYD